ncbi:hypothetical protein G9A89_009014 [Geosiphon pyriformis]|nr:hypothetical protein G9A89_009014 [Geosiphon pyriformis]
MSSKKKTPKGVFYGLAGGFFFQKKRVVLKNIKHSDNKKDISLNKSEHGNSVYSNVDSLSGDEKDADMTGINVGSLLNSAANTPKVKCVNTGVIFGSLLRSFNYNMDNDDEVSLSSYLLIFLEKKWIDPKIIKTQMEFAVKKLFALNINLLAVIDNSAMVKTQIIRKLFSSVNGDYQIYLYFRKNMKMAISLAKEKGITINGNLKRQGMRSDWTVVIKKILMNTLKNMIIFVVSKFGEIKSIKIQLIGIWQKTVVEFVELNQANFLASKWLFLIGKNSVCVAKTVEDYEIWASKDQFKALLFILPMGTTAYNLGTLLKKTSGKTCVINRSMKTGNRICCTVVGFNSNNNLESAFHTEPIFGSVKLFWTKINLVQCEKYGKLGYFALECDASVVFISKSLKIFKRIVSDKFCLQLTKLYKKKSVPISRPIAFDLNDDFLSVLVNNSSLDAFSGIVHKLKDIELMSQALSLSSKVSATLIATEKNLALDMVVDNLELVFSIPFFAPPNVSTLGLNSLKVLTTKVGSLESKLVALETFVGSVLTKLDHLCAGLDFLGAGVVIIMDISLACHVSKVEEISG